MIDLVSLYPEQDESSFRSFCEQNEINPIVLSTVPIVGFDCMLFIKGPWPLLDDQYNHYISFLRKCQEKVVRILDWQHLTFSPLSENVNKLSKSNFSENLEICQENIRAEDYRLPPFMENLIMISNGIFGQELSKPLFEKNPFVYVPKVIQGPPNELIKLFEKMVEMRRGLRSDNLTTSLISLNILCV